MRLKLNKYFTKEKTSYLTEMKQENNGFPNCFPVFSEFMQLQDACVYQEQFYIDGLLLILFLILIDA